mmetsp:Transcript_58021/g.186398  ORF Transcript_58021/g.186398 Transcript_58021/m.186398 type:complete len:377 (-) Transcript_58021:56-1186(-)
MRGIPRPAPDLEGSSPQCRICLSSDEDGLGALVAPCNCSGSMRYVHVQCLRTWRRQGGWRRATKCPVCRAAYRDDVGQRSQVERLFLLCPVVSVAGAGTLLLRLLVPWLHCHLSGAVWMYVASPLMHRLDLWHTWEVRGGMARMVVRWLLGGALSLLLPAVADHVAVIACNDRPLVARASELALLFQLCSRFRFLTRAAYARSFEGTRIGILAKRRCSRAIAETLQQARGKRGHTPMPMFMGALMELNRRYRMEGPLMGFRDRLGTEAEARILQLLLRARMSTEVSMLLSDSERWVWWWPQVLLWYWAEQDVPATMLARATALVALLTTSAAPALASVGVSDIQAQAALFSALTLLCSAFRGARAVRLWALRLSVA